MGPISLLCIRRAVADGRLHGIVSGIGVATADSFYAAVAVLGLTAISGLITAQQVFFRAVAGTVLIAVGFRVFLTIPHETPKDDRHESFVRDYLSLLAITLANPLTILFFLVVLPGFGIVLGGTSFFASAEFVLGIFCGSVVWWVVLCGVIGSVRSRLNSHHIRLINLIAGILIICFGIGTLLLLLVNG